MNRVVWLKRIVPAAILVVAGAVSSTPAWGQTQAAEATRLDLGFDTEQPGHEVVMPLMLDLPEGVEVRTAISEISFPTDLLSFGGVSAGLSAQAAGAEVNAVEKPDDQNPENTLVTVTVSTQQEGAIPSGMIADLVFTISEDAPIELAIPLGNVVSALTTDDPPRPVDPITGKEGEIVVSATSPVFACFFYMH